MFQSSLFLGCGTFSVVVNNQPYTVTKEHPRYKLLLESFKSNDSENFIKQYEVKVEKVKSTHSTNKNNKLEVRDGNVFLNGEHLSHPIAEAIKNMIVFGIDFNPMLKFLDNLLQNPSKRSLDELYRFLSVHKLTITEDGCFLAYKCVRDNYKDKYTGTFDNSIGAVNEMSRNEVDDNFNNACSKGFHVGAFEYSGPNGQFYKDGDKVIIVKVNPKDVVSVPIDSNSQKVRVCRYEVVGDYKGKLEKTVYSGNVNSDDYDDSELDDDDISISSDEMLPGNQYMFTYNSPNKGVSVRHVLVLELDKDSVLCELIYPEDDAGSLRRFKFENMNDVTHIW